MKAHRGVRIAIFATVLGALVMATGARAQGYAEENQFAQQGFYVGLGFVYSIQQLPEDEVSSLSGFDAEIDDSMGIDARFGYRFNRYVASELEVLYNFGFTTKALGMELVDANSYSVMYNVKVYPLAGRFQPYAILGLGFNGTRIKDTVGLGMSESFFDFGFRGGAGVDMYATSSVVGFVEISYLKGGFNDLDGFNFIPIVVGLQYRF